ncbi:serine/threonine-protein kinase [Streptosporangium sp. NPDC048865]|uniref:serine/threonine-protein kinase n=1 Tax=Streptosporangium sp. NPDC048865 TaxID=3155766 RepID=UPI00344039CE
MIGELIAGRYTVESYLGGGAMGDVWLARDLTLNRMVALKRTRAEPGQQAELTARALREAEALARIDHPGIVRVHDVLELADGPCIVMTHVKGTTLSELIKKGRLSEAAVAGFGTRALDALTAAHAEGVLHRDIKPDNILVTGTDHVVLVDFGIAAIDGRARITATGNLIGTIDFMAPERLKGQTARKAADLWSLGATLYTALEGRPPFQRDSVEATIAAILRLPPNPMTRSTSLTATIERLLDKNPSSRMRGNAFMLALGRSPVPVPPPPSPVPPGTGPPPAETGPLPVRTGREVSVRRAREALAGTDARHAAAALAALAPGDAAALLAEPRFELAGPVVEELCEQPAVTARILQIILPPRAGRLLDQVRPGGVAEVVLNMDGQRGGRVLSHMTDRRAAAVIKEMAESRPLLSSVIVSNMLADKAGHALRHLGPDLVADLLVRCPAPWRGQVLPFMTDAIRDRVRRRLRDG